MKSLVFENMHPLNENFQEIYKILQKQLKIDPYQQENIVNSTWHAID